MTTSVSLETKYDELQRKYKQSKKRIEELENQMSSKKHSNSSKIQHDRVFWLKIEDLLDVEDTEPIKMMIKDKEMTVNDLDGNGMTILIMASWYEYHVYDLYINSKQHTYIQI